LAGTLLVTSLTSLGSLFMKMWRRSPFEKWVWLLVILVNFRGKIYKQLAHCCIRWNGANGLKHWWRVCVEV
jgi:hypothetical protein